MAIRVRTALPTIALLVLVGACAGGPSPTATPSAESSGPPAGSPTTNATDGASPTPIVGCLPDAPEPSPGAGEVLVWFTCRDAQDPARVGWTVRHVSADADDEERLRTALEELLRGPNETEDAAGMTSWFSSATDGALLDVTIDADGVAVIDLGDFSRIIPNASTSAGSAMLIGELNTTVFQLPDVAGALYRFDGDCEAFWNWLQAGCHIVTRD